jgi:nitroreductase
MTKNTIAHQVFDLARWAPSGDNTQPWRFEFVDDRHVRVHGFDTRHHCVYDLDGHASQLSHGALLETAAIAATQFGHRAEVERSDTGNDERLAYHVRLVPDPAFPPDRLGRSIAVRTVQRRPMSLRLLTDAEKSAIEAELPRGYRVAWFEGGRVKARLAALLFASAKIRLTMPEAYRVHRDVIEWDARHSVDKVPDQALGVNAASLRMMRFAMHSWERVAFFNRYLAGTLLPRVQMDWWPAIACGAHFALLSDRTPAGIDDYVSAGRATQRLWLAATASQLQLQPALTPLIFSRYAREQRRFAEGDHHLAAARDIARRLGSVLEAGGVHDASSVVFMGRIGEAPVAHARSLRLSLEALTVAS